MQNLETNTSTVKPWKTTQKATKDITLLIPNSTLSTNTHNIHVYSVLLISMSITSFTITKPHLTKEKTGTGIFSLIKNAGLDTTNQQSEVLIQRPNVTC